jgi:hypothetical protein
MMEPVTTGQIYWGAVPFVVIQCIMVALVVMFPGMVMHYKKSAVQIDPGLMQERLQNLAPSLDLPGMDMNAPPKL